MRRRTGWHRPAIAGLVLVWLAGIASEAQAWGPRGHRLVGLIAAQLLEQDARTAVVEIMGSADLASFALHMDIFKTRLAKEIPGSRDWHYDDVPMCPDPGPPPKPIPYKVYGKQGNYASTQIPVYRGILADVHSSKDEKRAG